MKTLIKVAHVLYSTEVGGLENGAINLINRLDEQRYVHVICCLTPAGRLLGRLERGDVEQLTGLGKQGQNDWALSFRLARLFRRIRPDIVHTRNWGTIDGILAARLSGVPAVVHGEHGRTMAEMNGGSPRRALIRRLLSPAVSRFVTVSLELRQWLTDLGIQRRKIRLITNGVDLTRFTRSKDKSAAKAEHGLDPDWFVIGTVGRLDPIKDHTSLIQAFSCLAPVFPLSRLVIVGDGPCSVDLMGLTDQLGLRNRVLLLGEQDEIPGWLQCFDLFALPSLFEGISNTILEAMATALPVVATEVGGNIELVDDQVTGRLVAPRDVAVLSQTLQHYLEEPDLARRHGDAGRMRATRRFSLSGMVEKYDALYSGLASRTNRAEGWEENEVET